MPELSTAVTAAADGERVDRLLALLTGLSRSRCGELVASGAVRLDDVPVTGRATRVRAGQQLGVAWTDGPSGPPAADPGIQVPVLLADPDVVVVDKPAGLVVHPGSGTPDGTLVNGLLATFPDLAGVGDPARPGVVHRLDRGTSGLLMLARNPHSYESLVGQLARRTVSRRYLALVRGIPDAPAGLVDAPLGRSRRDPTRMAVRHDGKEARTRYQVEARYEAPVRLAMVSCVLETGRTHQIRAHLAAIGHPVVGDDRYGGHEAALAIDRPFLHAAELAFDHPGTGERLRLASPLPPELRAIVRRLQPALSG